MESAVRMVCDGCSARSISFDGSESNQPAMVADLREVKRVGAGRRGPHAFNFNDLCPECSQKQAVAA
jgi:hypothetical protein